MNLRYRLFSIGLLVTALALSSFAQFKDPGTGAGVGFGGMIGKTDFKNIDANLYVRGFLRHSLVKHLQGELGAAFGRISGSSDVDNSKFSTTLIPIEYRLLLSPFTFAKWNPYIYAGGGALYYEYYELPINATERTKSSAWTGVIPVGAGLEFALNQQVVFEVSGGYNQSLNKTLDALERSKNDGYWTFALGLTGQFESDDADADGDGLTNGEERKLGTDPHNPDTDGDGLSDGDEIKKYNTNPLKADSDGDGLNDKDEITIYKTDPNKVDTDGDGLSDGDEVMKYKTDPNKADTDGDGLSDGDEVMKYKTDPLKADTDGDGLSDGDEVMKYKTDPLKADTDGGGVNDGQEIANGTNPLDPTDDYPKKKEEFKAEVGKAILLEGVVFMSGKADIAAESEEVLNKAYNTLAQNAGIAVEIEGFTDNVGNKAKNVTLSKARAESVKAWLVSKGIEASRITTKGYGPERPVAPNTTPEGRQKNRRIEFLRTK